MRRAGLTPDPWQQDVLASDAGRIIILCSRQAGKSQVVAALALLTALVQVPAMVLILARSLRQSSELFRKVKLLYRALKRPHPAQRFLPRPVKELEAAELVGPDGQAVKETTLEMELANGSRIVSLPGNPDTLVGFSPDLVIIDEASRVPDTLYKAVRPMLAATHGRLVLLSTPYGRRGFFYEEWEGRTAEGRPLARNWHKISATALEIPRISPAFLEEERASLGERWYRQEYLCSFEDVEDAVFRSEDIERAARPDVETWDVD